MAMISKSAPPTNNRRLTVLAFCLTFGFTVIVGQLIRYQIVDHVVLSEQEALQHMRDIEIPAVRGRITDINGNLLASDVVQWDIEVSPPLVPHPKELAGKLAPLVGMPQEELSATVGSKVAWAQVDTHVDHQIGEAILALDEDGITCIPKPLRFHPESVLFGRPLGIVNDAGDGFYGCEGYYNTALKGVAGKKRVQMDPAGQEIPRPPVSQIQSKPGVNLVLTLDRNIQYMVEQELQQAMDEFDAQSGLVVVMQPHTGAILASVSLPTYDPNDLSDTQISLLADPVVSSMWEPGSIFKLITWSAGLDSETISPGTTFYDEGALEVGGRVIQNWDRQGHGLVTMTDGLVQSLNTVASFISTSVGKDRFYNYLRRFGFGQLTEVDLASEGPGMMKLPGDSNWFPSDLGTNSFGQGIAVTPIQMITAAAAIANQGVLMKPHIVDHMIVDDGSGGNPRVVHVVPMSVRGAISQETAQTLTDMMVEVVEMGADKARVPGYRIAGKSGTAQIPTAYGYEPTDTIASFIGFAPADDPQFIVLVKLDRPQASPWGTQTAAPAFRAIAERLFVYMQIPPDEIRLAQQ
jgi:cell division protein FtsI/penicillin-binding protein 2